MKNLLAVLLLVLANLCLANENEAQFQSMEEARKSFADRKLCFIGVLEDYTDSAGDRVDPDQEIVRGVRFSILWSAKDPKPASHWLHVCFEPASGEIFGERKKTYAATFEGSAKFGGTDVDAWPECAWAFKFTPIKIKRAPAVAPKPQQPRQRKVEQGGADQPASGAESKLEGKQKAKPESGMMTDTEIRIKGGGGGALHPFDPGGAIRRHQVEAGSRRGSYGRGGQCCGDAPPQSNQGRTSGWRSTLTLARNRSTESE